jgi:hypothetical protein
MTPSPHPEPQAPDLVLDGVAAGLWPSLSPADRRDRARRALGLLPVAPWGERMVYVEAAPAE